MTHRFNAVKIDKSIELTGYLDIGEIAEPVAPDASIHRIYSKLGDGLWTKDSSGNELSLIDIENSSTGVLTGGIIGRITDTPVSYPSTTTITTTGSDTFADGDTITISGSASNDGDYTVTTHVGTLLTISETLGYRGSHH